MLTKKTKIRIKTLAFQAVKSIESITVDAVIWMPISSLLRYFLLCPTAGIGDSFDNCFAAGPGWHEHSGFVLSDRDSDLLRIGTVYSRRLQRTARRSITAAIDHASHE